MIAIPCKVGDVVEVRSIEEILATLDDDGCLDNLPFMPEMLEHCGKRFKVAASAHKTCDSTYYGNGRAMQDAVFLEDLRCSGAAHGGCQAGCLIFFKLRWLKPIEPQREWAKQTAGTPDRDLAWLHRTTVRQTDSGERLYSCQATRHLSATEPFEPNAWRMFVADVRTGNASLFEVFRARLLLLVWHLRNLGFGWRVAVLLYDRLHRLFYGTGSPDVIGTIPKGASTPDVRLDLKPGELIRVRNLDDIGPTLSVTNRNRGLSFTSEMSPFCGKTFKVARRIERIVDEKSGKMIEMKGPCILLDGVLCTARYHPEAVLCPRKVPMYFREAWLERAQVN